MTLFVDVLISKLCPKELLLWLSSSQNDGKQGLNLAEVRESSAPRFLEGLLDFDWLGVRLTPKIKREAVPEPLKIQKWQAPF